MKKTTLIVLMILLMVGRASALNVSPNNYNLDVVGGDSVTKNITVSYSGDAPVVVNMSTNKIKGIDVSYSDKTFPLYPGKKTISLYLNFSVAIKPDTYTIDTRAKATVDRVIEEDTDTDIIYKNKTKNITEIINKTRVVNNTIVKYRNITNNITKYKIKYKNKTVYKNRTVNQTITETKIKKKRGYLFYSLLFLFILSLLSVLFVVSKNYFEEQTRANKREQRGEK